MATCPNLSIPKVKEDFTKMSNVLGEANAYHVWSENNGNSIFEDNAGNPSKTYADLVKLVGEEEAMRIKAYTFTNNFKDVYGSWDMAMNEPELTPDTLSFVSPLTGAVVDKVDSSIASIFVQNTRKPLKMFPPTNIGVNYHSRIANNLSNIFNSIGVNVRFIPNTEMKENATVETVDDMQVITFNPNKLAKDTVFHEFGHIYVDLIKDQAYIDFAVEQLRDTKIWKDIENRTTLTGKKLGREVLVTVIGEEAARMNNKSKFEKKLQFIINTIIHKFAQIFKIETSVAKKLAQDLVTGNLTHKLDYYNTVELQAQEGAKTADRLESHIKYLTDVRNKLNAINKQSSTEIRSLDYDRYVNSTRSAINTALLQTNRDNVLKVATAISRTTQFNIKMVEQIEEELNGLKDKYIDKQFVFTDGSDTPGVLSNDFNIFADTLWKATGFIQTFEELDNVSLKNLEVDIADVDIVDDIAEFNKYINTLRDAMYGDTKLVERVNELEKLHRSLMDYFASYIVSLSSDPKFKDAGFKEYLAEFTYELVDENKMNLIFDSLYDSPNKYISNIAKLTRINYGERDIEKTERIVDFYSEYAKVNPNDIVKIIENGRLLQKYDSKRFNDFIKEKVKTSKDKYYYFLETYTKNPAFDENIDSNTSETIRRVMAEKLKLVDEGKMTNAAYTRWFRDNLRYHKTEDIVLPKLYGEFMVPIDMFLNDKYAKLKETDDVMFNFLKYMSKEMQYLTEHIANTPQYKGYLAAISTKKIKHDEQMFESDEENTDINNNKVLTIPFPYLGYLNAKPEIEIPHKLKSETVEEFEKRALEIINSRVSKANFQTLAEVRAKNKELYAENVETHSENLNTDLGFTMPLFIESALNHKYKSKIKSTMLLSLHKASLNSTRIGKTNIIGKQKYAKGVTDYEGNRVKVTMSGIESNSYKHLENAIRREFFENYVNKDKFNKPLQKLRNYTSLLGMGFNIFAAGKNIQYGTNMTIFESIAGKYFNRKDLVFGYKQYGKGTSSYVVDFIRDDTRKTSFNSAVITMFNVIENYTDLLEKQNPSMYSKKFQKTGNTLAFFLTTAAEHQMHNTSMFAMLNSHKIINGKIRNYYDFIEDMVEKANPEMTKVQVKQMATRNKEVKAKAKEEFKKYPNVFDSIEMATDDKGNSKGYTQIKKDKDGKQLVTNTELILFKERVKGVNHKLHGIYNKIDKGTIESSIYGQLLMQFRHWMRPGYVKRFGATGLPFQINQYWNERRMEYDIGDYNSFFKMISMASVNKYNELSNKSEKSTYNTTVNVLAAIFQGGFEYAANMRTYWHMLTEQEKVGVRRTLSEFLTLASLIVVSIAYGYIDDGDDEEEVSYATNFLLYQLDAAKTELSTYVPIYGWFNEALKITANPTGTWNIFMTSYKAAWEFVMFPFTSDKNRRYQRGYKKGDYKALVYAQNLTPGWNVANRWLKLEDSTKSYKLFHLFD